MATTTPDTTTPVTIDFETAEYLSVLIGQCPWGDQKRRAAAAAKLAEALGTRPLVTAGGCFKRTV